LYVAGGYTLNWKEAALQDALASSRHSEKMLWNSSIQQIPVAPREFIECCVDP